MKKLLALFALLLLFSAAQALAEKPVNPYRDERFFVPSGLNAKGSLSVSITMRGTPECDSNLHFDVSASGGSSPYKYRAYIQSAEAMATGRTTYYCEPTGSGFDFVPVAPDTYYVLVQVIDAKGASAFTSYTRFTIEETPDHPSVNTIVSRLAAQCMRECSTEYERALWVHDYLTHHAYYDLTYSNYGPDGVLLRGTGVCDSYRQALTKLLNAMGIQSAGVTGGNHSWNIVRLEGEWYMIDPTWDDPTTSGNNDQPISGIENHDYFGITTEMLRYDHTIQSYDLYNEPCVSLACNYAVRSGTALRNATQSAYGNTTLANQITANLEAGITEFDPETPPFYWIDATGNDMSYSVYNWHLAWPPVAWVISHRAWPIGEHTYFLDIDYDLYAQTMHAQAAEECLHDIPNCRTYSLSLDSHTMHCSRCGVDITAPHTRLCDSVFCECGLVGDFPIVHKAPVLTDLGDGTHRTTCATCGFEGAPEVHVMPCNAGACSCGATGEGFPIVHGTIEYIPMSTHSHVARCSLCREEFETLEHEAYCDSRPNVCDLCGGGPVIKVKHEWDDGSVCVRCSRYNTILNLPKNLKRIADEAFAGTNCTCVYVPSGCTAIGARAFADGDLEEIHIPASVTSIANNACDGVAALTIHGAVGSAAERFARARGYAFIAEEN